MGNLLVKCTVKSAVYKKMVVVSSLVLIIPGLVFLYLNIYASIILGLIYIVVLFIIANTESYCLTEDGVYVCNRNGSIIYGYKYSDIGSVGITRAGNYIGIVISNDKFRATGFLTIRDKTKITVPEYVDNFKLMVCVLGERTNAKLSVEVREYIKENCK